MCEHISLEVVRRCAIQINVYFTLHKHCHYSVVVWTLDLKSGGCGFDSLLFHFRVIYTDVPCYQVVEKENPGICMALIGYIFRALMCGTR